MSSGSVAEAATFREDLRVGVARGAPLKLPNGRATASIAGVSVSSSPNQVVVPTPNVAATFCATLVDEWARGGVRHAVMAPGSRSTPLALALAASELQIHVAHDERVASFIALGIGLASGAPAVLLCTSGTAATHFHGAVVEAHQAEVPLIVCTADRPPELRDTGAAQTIAQTALYGPAVRWFHDPGPPSLDAAVMWRPLAARAVLDASGPRPGPVHLNLPFREPLVGDPGPLPDGRPDIKPWTTGWHGAPALDDRAIHELVGILERQRGVIVVGAAGTDARLANAVHDLAERIGWPVLADPRSGCRIARPASIAAFDDLVRDPAFADAHTPEVVLRIGAPLASKELNRWLNGSGATQVHVHPTSAWIDPDHMVDHRVIADPVVLCERLGEQLVGAARTPWLARWRRAEAAAQQAIDGVLFGDKPLSEPAVARGLVAALADGAHLVVSSSMPVRDVEWYAKPRDGLTVHSNRGANGIDGVISTSIGVALATGRPTAVLIGDVAFLHDSTALVALAARTVDLTIVVVDNDGGGIFSFLPQATAVASERFEQLYGTPHGTDIVALLGAHGLAARRVSTVAEMTMALGDQSVSAVVVTTDRTANVEIHQAIHRAVADAL
jgi:2-succinyl-5-enolpyruvyl-6-hydroxy-3-cyclohexene-1-carboxylate synthase